MFCVPPDGVRGGRSEQHREGGLLVSQLRFRASSCVRLMCERFFSVSSVSGGGDRQKPVRTQACEPVDVRRGGAVPGSAQQTQQTLQIHRHMHYNAEERRRTAVGFFMFLGQLYRWQLHGAMGEQTPVLHRQRVRTRHLDSDTSSSIPAFRLPLQ